ncbi:MAG: hypothetical protein ACOYO1_20000 [Bacteroidales bacterium]
MSELPKEFLDMILVQIKSNSQACNLDEIPQGYGEFGLEITNPVPVYGIPSNKTYLESLRTLDGNMLNYRRNGNVSTSNIESPIDEYEIYNKSGDVIAVLYISPYHWKTSEKVPKGFKMVN